MRLLSGVDASFLAWEGPTTAGHVSTNGMLDVGYVADRELVPDLWSMADRTGPALVELRAAVGAEISTS